MITSTGSPHLHSTNVSTVALDLFHHPHRGSSPFGKALSDLISILTKASSVADAAVAASTPDDEEQDAEELVCDSLRYLDFELGFSHMSPTHRFQILKRQLKMLKRS